MLNLKEGKILVKLARSSVENFFEKGKLEIKKVKEKKLKEKGGIFVTIETFPKKMLRGCIGFPYPALPLYEAVQKAAISSAFQDYRFESLRKDELEKIIFEVSALSEAKLIKVKNPKEYFKKIEIGKDGLILKHGIFSGLFLPQVWKKIPDIENFLRNLCWKAGLQSDCWLDKKTKIYKFRVQAFAEIKPRGEIIEILTE